ncbi:MAG: hypothetical protein ABIE23_03590 [archaeon]
MTYAFIQALILTCLIETIILVSFFFKETPVQKLFFASILINSITLPIVWLVLPLGFNQFFQSFLLTEAFVFLAESLMLRIILREIQTKRIITVAFAMNLPTAIIGLLL